MKGVKPEIVMTMRKIQFLSFISETASINLLERMESIEKIRSSGRMNKWFVAWEEIVEMTRENDTAAACYPDMATHQNVCVERERKRKNER